MKKEHYKLPWIDLHSTKNELVIHLIFHVFSQKSKKNQILKKNDRKNWIFDSGTVIQIVSAGILS